MRGGPRPPCVLDTWSLIPHNSPVGKASPLLEEGTRIPPSVVVNLLVGTFFRTFSLVFAFFCIFFAFLCQHRFFDRFFSIFHRFGCQQASIFVPKFHQHRFTNRSWKALFCGSILVSIFYRFVFDFGSQLGDMLATSSSKMA